MKLTNLDKLRIMGLGTAGVIIAGLLLWMIYSVLLYYAGYSGWMSVCKDLNIHTPEQCKILWRERSGRIL